MNSKPEATKRMNYWTWPGVISFLNLAFQVFLPALSFSQHKEASLGFTSGEVLDTTEYDTDLPTVPGEAVEYHSIQLIRDEFLMNIQKFANSIQRTMQQLEGEAWFFSSLIGHDEFTLRRI